MRQIKFFIGSYGDFILDTYVMVRLLMTRNFQGWHCYSTVVT